jgi:glycosyltransferase involved in cell wall biosynthesis
VPALDGRPFVLCLGRVEDGKGTTMLSRFFAAYKARHPGPHALVLAGPLIEPPPIGPDIVVTGKVSDEAKWALLRHADVVVNPSYFEAFSIALMEAWTAGRPTIVNGWCGPLHEHALASGGGVPFTTYAEFEAALGRLLGDDELRARLGRAGADYVAENFTWPRLIERYQVFLEQAANAASVG